jgi:hypothetical protein
MRESDSATERVRFLRLVHGTVAPWRAVGHEQAGRANRGAGGIGQAADVGQRLVVDDPPDLRELRACAPANSKKPPSASPTARPVRQVVARASRAVMDASVIGGGVEAAASPGDQHALGALELVEEWGGEHRSLPSGAARIGAIIS